VAQKKISIGDRAVGVGEPVFIIAEAGVNHNGDLSLALQLVDAAKAAGADAVKFQTFVAENVVTPEASKADYQKKSTGEQESQLEMVKRLELSFADFRKLDQHCRELDILFMSTPFDFESVDFLHELHVPAFKISSGDLTNHPLLQFVASKGRPIILSTGMSDLSEIAEAVEVIRASGNDQIALLQCVTNYPADAAEVNLNAMRTMSETFGVPVGYSDHTLGIEIALAAAALGAAIIEKHFTLDSSLPGPDHRASLEPPALIAMINGIRTVESALGDGIKVPAPSEARNALVARRSIVATQDIAAGSVISRDALGLKRPGTGLPPKMLQQVVGHTARVNVKAGELLRLDMFD
jgi:N-acetylneuraminate synthase